MRIRQIQRKYVLYPVCRYLGTYLHKVPYTQNQTVPISRTLPKDSKYLSSWKLHGQQLEEALRASNWPRVRGANLATISRRKLEAKWATSTPASAKRLNAASLVGISQRGAAASALLTASSSSSSSSLQRSRRMRGPSRSRQDLTRFKCCRLGKGSTLFNCLHRRKKALRGQSHEIFCTRFFPPNNSSWSHQRCPRAVLIFLLLG